MKKALLFMCMVFSTTILFAQTTYFVKTDGDDVNNDGKSWANAFATIAKAVTVANGANNDMIFVKAGTYTATGAEHIKLDGNTAANSGLKFYGGFVGASDSELPSGRTFADSTILVAQNAAASRVIYNMGVSGKRITDVVYDGFTITGASSSGMLSSHATIVVKNCIIKNNSTTSTGGGMYANYTTITIDNCKFYNNSATATNGNGGGILFARTGTATITNCVFDSNTAGGTGGYGGGIGTYAESTLPNTVNISNCTFTRNTAAGYGGGLTIFSYSTTTVSGSTFSGNTAATNGGGIFNHNNSSTPTIVNCLISGNKAATGGGMYNNSTNVKPNIINCTIAGNNATTSGGGIYNAGSGSVPVITNCIIYGNSSGIVNASSASATVTYSNVQFASATNEGNYTAGTGNINADPTFTNSLAFSTAPFINGDYTLGGNSNNAVNRGLTSAISGYTTDLLGNPRIYNNVTVDMGAYEFQGVLPVTISSFTASLVKNRTQLNWSVGTEINVNRYEVERSQNGVDFATVAKVSANGSSSYSATDAKPQLGVNYYRLVSIDNDGTTATYAAVKTVKVTSLTTESVQVYPNPVKGNVINVALTGYATGNYTYKLVNAAGATVQKGSVNYGGSGIQITTSAAAGVYVLYLSNGNNLIKTKLVKQ